jgi:succinate dehydrogenase / fumarate reductase cytochrome b subunit
MAAGDRRAGLTSDGRLIERPLSPHLQIYRPQITSVLSIMHRFTGLALAVGAILLVAWLAAMAGPPEHYRAMARFLGSPLGLLLLFGWTAALAYHFFNGIRHLGWDLGLGFERPEYHKTGKAVVAAAAGVTVLLWVIGLILW